ncbi:Gfo/Idh/MocA family oxidoreductase [Muricomes intestini]|jgi:predicted dehydrogenase|uniref:Gfo/Idh/MocA family protein n=1 Tax=Muricomes intestini TaxID=1796634 RepID=UPI000EDC59CA|nr:dehydrogenase [Lachnospiraceae bacterium]
MIKIGIIGCGKIAQVRHIPEYNANSKCKIIGVYDINQENANYISKKYNVKAFKTVDELLGSGVDAVSVCTSNSTHANMSIQALDSGKHVLCEKPMAITYDECLSMCKASQNANKLLMIGHNQRFSPTHIKAREYIASNKIGKVLSFHTTFGHPGPEAWTSNPNSWFFDKTKAHFGAMADLGVHKTDLIRFLLCDDICEVYSQFGILDKTYSDGSPISVDDNAFCCYKTKKGAMGLMHVSWTFYGNSEDNSTQIYGSKGILRLYDDPDYSFIFEPRDGEVQKYNLDQIADNKTQTDNSVDSTGIIDHFISSILKESKCIITGEEALKSMKVIFAAEESSKTNKKVIIN